MEDRERSASQWRPNQVEKRSAQFFGEGSTATRNFIDGQVSANPPNILASPQDCLVGHSLICQNCTNFFQSLPLQATVLMRTDFPILTMSEVL